MFFLQFHIHASLLIFVKHLTLLKSSLKTNQTLVQQVYETLQIMLLRYLEDICDISNFLLQMKNQNTTKLTLISL